jgi:hypothetical protein
VLTADSHPLTTVIHPFLRETSNRPSTNEVLSEGRSWRDNVVQEMQDYYDERSEKWQQSDKGQAHEAWKRQFDEEELEDVELEKPEPLEPDMADAAELLEQLPETPN